jgi:hypothetical protein
MLANFAAMDVKPGWPSLSTLNAAIDYLAGHRG